MSKASPLEGKHYWLLGASAGIGAALARQLSANGTRLTLSARDSDALKNLEEELGPGHALCELDVSKSLSRSMLPAADDLDGLIYCVGDYQPMTIDNFDAKRAKRIIDVNLSGAMAVIGHVASAWAERGSGHIVLVGSIAGHRALPRSLAYGASKAGLEHFAECLALDLGGRGVKVQLVRPGFVKTRLTDKNDFKMPLIMSAEQAAARIASGMAGSALRIDFPKPFCWLIRLLALLPHPLYKRLMRLGQ